MKKKGQGNNVYLSPSRIERQQQPKNLKEEFINELLGAQDAFKKYKTQQNLTRLITFYRKLVEHYSQKNDRISDYFSDKISCVSAQMPNIQQSDQRLTMSMVREVEDQKNPHDSRFKSLITTPVTYDPEMKKKQRSKNVQIAIEVNKVKKRANARTILKSYYQQWEQNNKIIMSDLKNQRKQLEDKLLAIHKKSLDVASKPISI